MINFIKWLEENHYGFFNTSTGKVFIFWDTEGIVISDNRYFLYFKLKYLKTLKASENKSFTLDQLTNSEILDNIIMQLEEESK